MPTVAGHKGELVFGKLADVPTICMRGRFHFYEGHPMNTVTIGVRVMRCLGVKVVVITNASGGLNPEWKIGDVFCIMDHYAPPNLAGNNPLHGPNDGTFGGPRFLPLSNLYDKHMSDIVMKAAGTLGFDFVRAHGCYAMVSGPTYETGTEVKFLRSVGCDSVGMSTVPELVVAHHCGMKAIGISLVTNKALLPGDTGPHASHKEVLETADMRASQLQSLVKQVASDLKKELEGMPALPKVDLNQKAQSFSKITIIAATAAALTIAMLA